MKKLIKDFMKWLDSWASIGWIEEPVQELHPWQKFKAPDKGVTAEWPEGFGKGNMHAVSNTARISHTLKDGSHVFGGIYKTSVNSNIKGDEGLIGDPGPIAGDENTGMLGEPMPLRNMAFHSKNAEKFFNALFPDYKFVKVLPTMNPERNFAIRGDYGILSVTVLVWYDGHMQVQTEENPVTVNIFKAVETINKLGYYTE